MSDIRLAHLSDWHATSLVGGGAALLHPKRLSGWASWRLGRRHRHRADILEAAIRDVHAQAVDLALVTGDLTHVSLEQEFVAAAEQLAALGGPERVFLIPGNHDRYVAVDPARSWDHWAAWLRGADPAALPEAAAECLAGPPAAGRAPRHVDYPTLRIVGSVAVVGLCSAVATPLFRASGMLGDAQLERLECLLRRLRALDLCRVVLVHHPLAVGTEPRRRALSDASALLSLLEREGAELVLHGHKHRRRVHAVPGPDGSIPSIGVPSASEVGSRPGKRAQYHVYRVHRDPHGGPFAIDVEVRGYDPGSGAFGRVAEPVPASLLDEVVEDA